VFFSERKEIVKKDCI